MMQKNMSNETPCLCSCVYANVAFAYVYVNLDKNTEAFTSVLRLGSWQRG